MRVPRSRTLILIISLAFWGLVAAIAACIFRTWGEAAAGFAVLAVMLGAVTWGFAQIILSAKRREKWDRGIYVPVMIAIFCLAAGPLLFFKDSIPDELPFGGHTFGLAFLLMMFGALAFWAIGRTLSKRDAGD